MPSFHFHSITIVSRPIAVMLRCVLPVLLLTLLGLAAHGEDDPANPEALLKSKGLAKRGTTFSLADETDLNKRMGGFLKLKKTVTDMQNQEQRASAAVDDKKKAIIAMRQRREQLNAQIDQALNGNPTQYGKLVNEYNALGNKISSALESDLEEKALNAARVKADKAREDYTTYLMETRKAYDKIKDKYDELARDKTLADAVESYNKANEKSFKLGPTATFLHIEGQLKKQEDTVLSESIDMRKEHGETWSVSVVFNDRYPQRLEVDTGASLIAVPWNMAKQIGLTPPDNAPTIQLEMADGRVIDAKQVIAKKVRVGGFSVENVECAVIPQEYTKAAACLGQTFLQKFTYKIDTNNSKLIMSRVDTGETPTVRTKTPKGVGKGKK